MLQCEALKFRMLLAYSRIQKQFDREIHPPQWKLIAEVAHRFYR
jgi:hypothetical protein